MKIIDELSLKTISRGTKVGVLALGVALSFGVVCLALGVLYRLPLWQWISACVIACITVSVLHEALHGLFFKIFGCNVRVGAKMSPLGPVCYATSPDCVTRSQYQVVALAPQILTIAWLVILVAADTHPMATLGLIVAAAGNLGGGCFDLYTFGWLRRYPKDYKVLDIKDGLQVVTAN